MKEVLAGAVLELHERPENVATLRTERDEAVRLLQRTLEVREMGNQGVHKTSIRAFLARAGELPPEYRSVTRIERLQQLERDLVAMQPEADDALRLLQAWFRGIDDRYGKAKTGDLRERVNEVEEALGELEVER